MSSIGGAWFEKLIAHYSCGIYFISIPEGCVQSPIKSYHHPPVKNFFERPM